MIKAVKINRIYENGVHAVKDVCIELHTHTFYGIKGDSGSGKSTLLQLLSTYDFPTSGNVSIDNASTQELNEKTLSEIRMKKIGFIFQNFNLHTGLNALENVMLPMFINKSYCETSLYERACSLLEAVGLKDRFKHYPKQLSGGEQQRVAIARAMANDPEYIFADEPTGNLDSDNERIIFDYLKEFAQNGKCVTVVSHNKIIEDYADVLYHMHDGELADWMV